MEALAEYSPSLASTDGDGDAAGGRGDWGASAAAVDPLAVVVRLPLPSSLARLMSSSPSWASRPRRPLLQGDAAVAVSRSRSVVPERASAGVGRRRQEEEEGLPLKMFPIRCRVRFPKRVLHRLYSTRTPIASSYIRNRFLEYFVNDNDHTHVRSCPLKPINDETIPFVNAGMVQFKPVLLGQTLPPALKAANSQKCARVGGKHNDLDIVGTDGYHHTFFEMLGNWSFGSCNKLEACRLAWQLLISSSGFGLNPNRLYVTYFGGDVSMSLEPDFETKEIWRQLGVEESHIIPFGAKENFWEMGLVGPCGPCTEIHIDHFPNRLNASDRVNAGYSDLTELWNIVFIQYNRNLGGQLDKLNQSHIDTGMGFERLVAVMNGSQSNYDTDLFKPMMNIIHKTTGCPAYSSTFDKTEEAFERDTAYRILCDHSRLLTVALADNIVPHQESKLRRVLRRALNVTENIFKKDQMLLVELTNYVADSLHSSFPEIGKSLSKVQRVIRHEAELYNSLKRELPKTWIQVVKQNPEVASLLEFGSNREAIAAAYKKLSASTDPEVSPALAYQFFESNGMNTDLIAEMAKLCGKKFNVASYETELENVKFQSKLTTAKGETRTYLMELLSSSNIVPTNDKLKYDFDLHNDTYSFPSVSAKVVGLLVDGVLENEATGGTECGIILDKTNFYHSAGGQISDKGNIKFVNGLKGRSLTVKDVIKIGEHVVHFGNLNGSVRLGEEVFTEINETSRMNAMRNHTLAHLINGEMQRLFDAPLQEKCVVQPSYLKMTYSLNGEEFTEEDARKLEEGITHVIADELTVNRYSVNMWQIPLYTTLVPDETYPVENIHIIDISRGKKVISREACCGTHVLNTKDIGKFCIVEVLKSKKTSVCAVTGSEASEAIANSLKLADSVTNFVKDVAHLEDIIEELEERTSSLTSVPPIKSYVQEIKRIQKAYVKIRNFVEQNGTRLSYVTYAASAAALEEATAKVQSSARYLSELEVKRKAEGARYVVHAMQLSDLLIKVPLNKYTRLVDVPIMLLALHKTELKMRCCVPKAYLSEEFNADKWMAEALSHIFELPSDGEMSVPKAEGQSLSVQSCLITFRHRISARSKQERCWKAIEACTKLARLHVSEKTEQRVKEGGLSK
ncbi:Alanine--tRNA ligase, mitochondrial [Frankliniella fusca]|uniref:Alanine--tRNA ligase n=1 Tax=Frankliniella fusca TaxID=407009 RepID=A0AAE1L5H6_9NEOP|nr:Alanine--tRNA ligase, mitochondrial [Frankliniella fusca]